MLAERDAVLALPPAIGGRWEGVGAERVAAEVGDGPLGDDVVVFGLGEESGGGDEEVEGRRCGLEEVELDLVDGSGDRDWGIRIRVRHWRAQLRGRLFRVKVRNL